MGARLVVAPSHAKGEGDQTHRGDVLVREGQVLTRP